MIQTLTIRSRLILLSGALLCMLVATNVYLTRKLADSSAAIAVETDLGDVIEAANGARIAFGDMRYWLTDLAVSLLTISERNAAAARARMDGYLDRLATRKPDLVAAVRGERSQFEKAANDAVDQYTNDRRVIGNSLLAQARDHSVKADALLAALIDELKAEIAAERQRVVAEAAAATRWTLIADLVILAAGILLTLAILRSIASPLRRLVGSIDALSAGNLSAPIPPAGHDEIGAMARTLGLFRDSLEERNRLAVEAEEQRKTIDAAIATISEGFVLYDAQDRIVLFNEQFRRIYPALADIIHPGTTFRQLLDAVIERSLVDLGAQSPQEWIAEREELRTRSHGFVEYRYGGRFIRISERSIQGGGTVAVYSDITELRQRNLELEHAREQSEVANRTKSQFLANMSHELRTPLNAIIGYSEILQEDAGDAGQDRMIPDLKRIEGAGRHLLGLINDILDLSKIEAGRMDVFLEDFEIPPLLTEVKAIIAPLAAQHANSLEMRLADDLGSLRTDRTKLKQSLLNLLSNASKFTTNGRLTLDVERIEAGSVVRFRIADTGIGMSEEQLGRLFTAFSQADASTTKKFGGTGLGLAITRHFCQILGGDITVSSRPGEGSTFTILLPDQTAATGPAGGPEASAAAQDEVPRGGPADAGAALTVLVVDDDPAALDLLGAGLQREGYRVVKAHGGEEALALARKVGPDAITLDILMPRTDGWAVLTALKADDELGDIPVVMVSIAPDRGIGLTLGAAEVLTKPVDRVRLMAVLRRLISREGRTLVVEDDAATREVIRHTVEKLGHAVAEVENGARALAWLAGHPPPSVILLDLMMPEMDGFEFLDRVKGHPQWRDIPVIVVTAKQLTPEERNRLAGQVRTVIAKSVSIDTDIARAIRRAVSQRTARPAPADTDG